MPRGPERRAIARAAAEEYGGVLSRRLLREHGIDCDQVRTEVEADRWKTHGLQTVAVERGPLNDLARGWRAVWEVGHRIAVLDGLSALQHAGLTGFTSSVQHVSIPQGCRPYKVPGVVIHQVQDPREETVLGSGIPRARPAVAAVRAAHWAMSDRQAALVLCMAIQQRLTTPDRLRAAEATLRVRGRKAFVAGVVDDLTGGVHSLGELDFARLCRARRLPEPSRQALVDDGRGRIYLDVRWDHLGLVVEIDGAQHRMGLAVTEDNLSRNVVAIHSATVLRIDVIGLRLFPDRFLDQVCAAHAHLSKTPAA